MAIELERRQLVALCASIVFAGADNSENAPGYSPRGAVTMALEIIREAWRDDELDPQNDMVVCPHCDRIKLAGSSFYQADVPTTFNEEGARLITCPECKAKRK